MIDRMMKPTESDVESIAGESATETRTNADSEVPTVDGASRLQRPADDADLQEYGRILGADFQETDMAWLVLEAFEAPLPRSWTEHMDAEGRVYFFNQVNEESSWAHPMDVVYTELISVVQTFRAKRPKALPEPRLKAVKEHLDMAHKRSIEQLEGWSGPYASEDNGEYFYNERLNVSTWVNPVADLEYELAIRQSVLYRCLLPDFADPASLSADANDGNGDLDLLRFSLPLELAQPRDDDSQMSSRSFYSARESSRSGHSERSLRELRDALNSPSRALKSEPRSQAKEVTVLESHREEAAEES